MPSDRSPSTAVGRPQQTKYTLVTGGAAGNEFTVTGIRSGRDSIVAVLFFAKAAEPLPEDITANVTIPKADKIKIATTNTTSGKVLVIWRHAR